jgi:NADPH2:quinone reductase
LKNLAWEGRYISVGFASGIIPKISVNRLLLKSSYAIGLYWGEYAFINPELIGDSFKYLIKLYMKKKLNPLVGNVFKIEQARDALDFLLSRKNTGKIILSCN